MDKKKLISIGIVVLTIIVVSALIDILLKAHIMEITAPFVVLKVIRQKTNRCKAYLESAIFVMNLKVSI